MNLVNLLMNRGALLAIFRRLLIVAALLFIGFIALIWWSIATLVEMNQRSQAATIQIEQLEKRLDALDRKLDRQLAAPGQSSVFDKE